MEHEELVDEDTGEIFESESKDFYILSPAFVYHNPEADYAIHRSSEGVAKSRALASVTSHSAMIELRELIKESYKK